MTSSYNLHRHRLSTFFFFCLATAASLGISVALSAAPAQAKRGNIPVLVQLSHNTTGTVATPQIRAAVLQDVYVTWVSDGDVMGPGTATPGREVYLHNHSAGTTLRVTSSGAGESYEATRITDIDRSDGRPVTLAFTSTADLDPLRDNSDGNAEIFLYEVESGTIHQFTDSAAPVVNDQPFVSDTAKCILFRSGDDLNDNDGSIPTDPGHGYSNADGSQEVFRYRVTDSANFPFNGYTTQVSSGPVGTVSSNPVVGGYVFSRQCQIMVYHSDHDQTAEGTTGEHLYIARRGSSELTRITVRIPKAQTDTTPPDGLYTRPYISGASPFARGPYVTFTSNADVRFNGSTGFQFYKYRVFRPEILQEASLPGFDVAEGGQVSDGGMVVAFVTDAEVLDPARGAKKVGPGPFNGDSNQEIFATRKKRLVWQITQSDGCTNDQLSINGDGRRIAFRSDCDLVPGSNAAGVQQAFLFERVAKNEPLASATGCLVVDGCCNQANGCYVDLKGRRIKIPRTIRP